LRGHRFHSRTREATIDFYLLAKGTVVGEGFGYEIAWQARIDFSQVNESSFLREAAWVVLSSGMRESVIRAKFHSLSIAFFNWHSARRITTNARRCRKIALRAFGHRGKITSIIEIARLVDAAGFDAFKQEIVKGGVQYLQSLPYIGPTTCYHLAKNLGLDVVKPDRHLIRISALMGYANPTELCRTISNAVGDRASVVDLVVWRYATLNPGYKHFLAQFAY
jgi:hypothetical protein